MESRVETMGRKRDPESPGGQKWDHNFDTGFTWTCPFCRESKTNRSNEEETGEKNAVMALRAHINASEGSGHGPRYEFPAEMDRPLYEYVRIKDGKNKRK